MPIGELRAQRAQSAQSGALVHGDKLDIRQQGHQPGLEPADDPCEAGFRVRALERPDHGDDMASVADCREPQEADAAWRCGEWQLIDGMVGNGAYLDERVGSEARGVRRRRDAI